MFFIGVLWGLGVSGLVRDILKGEITGSRGGLCEELLGRIGNKVGRAAFLVDKSDSWVTGIGEFVAFSSFKN